MGTHVLNYVFNSMSTRFSISITVRHHPRPFIASLYRAMRQRFLASKWQWPHSIGIWNIWVQAMEGRAATHKNVQFLVEHMQCNSSFWANYYYSHALESLCTRPKMNARDYKFCTFRNRCHLWEFWYVVSIKLFMCAQKSDRFFYCFVSWQAQMLRGTR